MKTRFPLYAKILVWFFVNLAVIAVAGWLLVREQFRFSALPARAASENLANAAETILTEALEKDIREWDDILTRASKSHGVNFLLYAADGRHIAGPRDPLPPPVRGGWFGPPRRPRGPGPLPPRPGAERPRPQERPFGPPQDREPPTERFLNVPLTAFIHTEGPDRYWAATRMDAPHPEFERGALLLAWSDSPTGHGFFFDIRPYLWGGAGVLVLSLLVWLPFVSGLTRSLSRMQAATKRIAEGDFEARGEEHRRDEVGALGSEINRMAARLAGYVAGQKRFLGDVAHELSAPVARLQVAMEILEQRVASTEGGRVADVREEVEHMAKLVNDLLQFTRAGMIGEAAALTAVNLAEITNLAVRREAADTSQIGVTLDPALQVQAVPELLQRAIGNVVRNAIRYAGHAGPITITAEEHGRQVHLIVTDNGPGIPPDSLPKMFSPFFRLDEARTAGTGGTGLGLTIVKTCIEACRGTVAAENHPPAGLRITMKLLKTDA
jgi:two-component system, OmpR family, sensor histidine kinase CpxA